MEIVESSEGFKMMDGRMQFHHMTGIVQVAEALYLAKWHDRRQKPSNFSQLYDVQRLETEDRGPVIQQHWLMAPANDSRECFIKTPSLYAFSRQVDLEKQILRELEACEVLVKHPHHNIASYYGYQETRGRVSALCFKHYRKTLRERVNPGHLSKSDFLALGQPLVDPADSKTWLSGILEGIRHLHSLGLVHNDINPANIIFDDDGTAVLIDFDSCRRVGESLSGTQTKRTYGWYDPDVAVAVEQNDMDAFAELRTWLCGRSTDGYLFAC